MMVIQTLNLKVLQLIIKLSSYLRKCKNSNYLVFFFEILFKSLAWKFRELQRLKRDRELREQEEAEQAERDRRRAMTEEERLKEPALNSISHFFDKF